MMQNRYPEFRAIEKYDRNAFSLAFQTDNPKISEFTFTNLFSWRNAYNFCISCLENMLLVRSEKGNEKLYFPPIGQGDKASIIKDIIKETGCRFIRVSKDLASIFLEDHDVNVLHDRDNSDYVFAAEDLIGLKGKKYDGKRNLLKKFRKMYQYEYINLDKSNANLMLDYEEKWCTIKNCDGVEGLRNERSAIREIVSNYGTLGLYGGAIRINNEVRAVAIAERLNAETLVLHILKADASVVGLYQTMMNEFLSINAPGYKYVNLEQDLGIEGLRRAKSSYHPSFMIDKYIIEPKGE